MDRELNVTERKCGDCVHCRIFGYWDSQHYCDVDWQPTTKDFPACVSLERKGAGRG